MAIEVVRVSKVSVVLAGIFMGMLSMSAYASNLTVTVDGLRSANGTIQIELDNSAAAWDNKAKPAATASVKAAPGSVSYTFTDVTPGLYSVNVLQDMDGSGKPNTGLMGTPKGGYGFSNNLTLTRKPTFEQALFEVTAKDTSVLIHLKHGV